ncbi:MAG: phosphoglycerate kinase [Legionellales bacterium]|nr:phosphoglycerate kinase [Legionellales bacterium]
MQIMRMSDINLTEQRVMIREDFNVPIENGVITSDARIQAAIPTIKFALEQNAKVILISHLGRPTEGQDDAIHSLEPVAKKLTELLGQAVRFEKHWLDGVEINSGEVVLCENVRFNIGEKENNEHLARKMANLCDVFVMDAFATAHRAQASTHGIACFAKTACAGPLLIHELEALEHTLQNPARPLLAIVGGAKVSTKLTVLEQLLDSVDYLIVGGGIANTFIRATGHYVGKSLYEENLLGEAKKLLDKAHGKNTVIPIPVDVVVATAFSPTAKPTIKKVEAILDNEMILDIGPETIKQYQSIIKNARTTLWNGPIGVFEFDAFATGTKAVAEAVIDSSAFSLAGGGDTLAALDKWQLMDQFSYISTGGGAFLEFIEGKKLPAIEILERRAQD